MEGFSHPLGNPGTYPPHRRTAVMPMVFAGKDLSLKTIIAAILRVQRRPRRLRWFDA